MITVKQIDELTDGCALLECLGNLYEYIGVEADKYIFQSLSNDRFIKTSYESLLTMSECNIQY